VLQVFLFFGMHFVSLYGIDFSPQVMQFPNDTEGFAIENQVYLGDTGILVHPIVKKDVEVAEFYIADTQVPSPVL